MNKAVTGIFITGTDTGVGKTYVAAGLASFARSQGTNVGVMKPAETGCRKRNGILVPADAVLLMKAAGVRDGLDDVNPYRFSKPLAPSVAAATDGRSISPGKIIRAFERLRRKHDCMIVEGAGGIMVPLSGRFTFLDLAADLRLPVLIVARPGLGTINHTLLTVNAVRNRKLEIAGIVINHAQPGQTGMAEKTNPDIIRELSGASILGAVRHGSRDMEHIAGEVFSLL